MGGMAAIGKQVCQVLLYDPTFLTPSVRYESVAEVIFSYETFKKECVYY